MIILQVSANLLRLPRLLRLFRLAKLLKVVRASRIFKRWERKLIVKIRYGASMPHQMSFRLRQVAKPMFCGR